MSHSLVGRALDALYQSPTDVSLQAALRDI